MYITKTNPAKFSYVGPMIVLSLKVGKLSRVVKNELCGAELVLSFKRVNGMGTSFEEVTVNLCGKLHEGEYVCERRVVFSTAVNAGDIIVSIDERTTADDVSVQVLGIRMSNSMDKL